jgi:cytochrome c2
MRNRLLFIILVGVIGATIPVFAQEEQAKESLPVSVADRSAEYFFYRCAGCHTVGGGKLTGPDLITAAGWSSVDLKSAVKKMEKNVGPLTQADIDQIADFLKDPMVSARISNQKQKVEAKLRAELPPPSYEMGQNLFRGRKSLSNGGPACITCHRFANEGGSLGPELTPVKEKLTGVALQSAIENSSYKVMRSIYEKRKITKEESLHLAEYLSHPEKAKSRFGPSIGWVIFLAMGGLIGCIAWLVFMNSKRKGRAKDILFRKGEKG